MECRTRAAGAHPQTWKCDLHILEASSSRPGVALTLIPRKCGQSQNLGNHIHIGGYYICKLFFFLPAQCSVLLRPECTLNSSMSVSPSCEVGTNVLAKILAVHRYTLPKEGFRHLVCLCQTVALVKGTDKSLSHAFTKSRGILL